MSLSTVVGKRTLVAAATVAGLALSGLSPAALAQSGLRLGDEPAEPVLDLGAPRAEPQTSGGEAPASIGTQGNSAGAGRSTVGSSGTSVLNPANSNLTSSSGDLERVTHGAWEVACSSDGPCAMAQIGNDTTGTPVLEMVIRKLPEPLEVGDRTAIAVLDVVTPLGVVLPEGVGLTIDSGRTEAAPYQICTEQGCLVREPIDDDLISRLKRGGNAKISLVAANQGLVESTLSLSGFTSAYNAVR